MNSVASTLNRAAEAAPMLSRALAQLGRAASTAAGIIEMRSYQMKPEATATYLQMCAETAAVRAEVAPGFLGRLLEGGSPVRQRAPMPRQTLSHCVTPPSPQPYSYTFGKPAISQRRMFSVEAGGPLNVVRHFYRYQDMEHRHAVRAAMPKNLDWRNFLSDSKAHLQSQESWIFVPCLDVMEAGGATPISELQPTIPSGKPAGGVYELRRYQLVPGYPTVPKLRELFCEGLPEKIAADQHGKLVAFAAR
mmetsp:Transcript_42724/g.109364  ORF Transcript_42724/g.109364 Transcript_42724/m.109364 type:complete len:249 (-) Transcript_42724:1082-1828(-)